MPEISIIVPVYNVEEYLHRCVDSILGQTFTDFELILVDDGSTDGSPAICDEYQKKDNRIKVIHKKNGGVSSARNKALDVATGKYIMFCDSDDYVELEWLSVMLEVAKQDPRNFVVCDYYNENRPINQDNGTYRVDYYDLYKTGVSPFVWNKIFKKSLIDSFQLRFDEKCILAEDVAFSAKYCLVCVDCVFIGRQLYHYSIRESSAMRRYYPNWFGLHLLPFAIRLPLISECHMQEYCNTWLFFFFSMFENVFDKRNKLTFFQKMRYNQQMMQSIEFRYCLEHATDDVTGKKLMQVLKLHNYYILWAFQKIIKLRKK